MMNQFFEWLGELNIYGVDPIIVTSVGFCILIFCISEFFRLIELLIVRIFGK